MEKTKRIQELNGYMKNIFDMTRTNYNNKEYDKISVTLEKAKDKMIEELRMENDVTIKELIIQIYGTFVAYYTANLIENYGDNYY